jgi:hypothetical protein
MKELSIINDLLSSKEPSLRLKTWVNCLGENRTSIDIINLEQEVKNIGYPKNIIDIIPISMQVSSFWYLNGFIKNL